MLTAVTLNTLHPSFNYSHTHTHTHTQHPVLPLHYSLFFAPHNNHTHTPTACAATTLSFNYSHTHNTHTLTHTAHTHNTHSQHTKHNTHTTHRQTQHTHRLCAAQRGTGAHKRLIFIAFKDYTVLNMYICKVWQHVKCTGPKLQVVKQKRPT